MHTPSFGIGVPNSCFTGVRQKNSICFFSLYTVCCKLSNRGRAEELACMRVDKRKCAARRYGQSINQSIRVAKRLKVKIRNSMFR